VYYTRPGYSFPSVFFHSQEFFFYLPVALWLVMFPSLLLKKKVVSLFLARPAQKTTAQQLVLDESDRENVAVIHPFTNNIVKRMLCPYCNYSITPSL